MDIQLYIWMLNIFFCSYKSEEKLPVLVMQWWLYALIKVHAGPQFQWNCVWAECGEWKINSEHKIIMACLIVTSVTVYFSIVVNQQQYYCCWQFMYICVAVYVHLCNILPLLFDLLLHFCSSWMYCSSVAIAAVWVSVANKTRAWRSRCCTFRPQFKQ